MLRSRAGSVSFPPEFNIWNDEYHKDPPKILNRGGVGVVEEAGSTTSLKKVKRSQAGSMVATRHTTDLAQGSPSATKGGCIDCLRRICSEMSLEQPQLVCGRLMALSTPVVVSQRDRKAPLLLCTEVLQLSVYGQSCWQKIEVPPC